MWSARPSSTTIRTAAAVDVRVDAVELQAAEVLVRGERDHLQRLGDPLDQRPGGDHLADVDAAALLAAEPAERDVGDAGHRGEHHRAATPVRTERQRGGECESHAFQGGTAFWQSVGRVIA